MAESDCSRSATAENKIDTTKAVFSPCFELPGGDGGGFHVAKGKQGRPPPLGSFHLRQGFHLRQAYGGQDCGQDGAQAKTTRPSTCRGGLSRRRLGEGGPVRRSFSVGGSVRGLAFSPRSRAGVDLERPDLQTFPV